MAKVVVKKEKKSDVKPARSSVKVKKEKVTPTSSPTKEPTGKRKKKEEEEDIWRW